MDLCYHLGMCQLDTERREKREDRDSLVLGNEWFSSTEAAAAREGQAWRELCASTPFSELGFLQPPLPAPHPGVSWSLANPLPLQAGSPGLLPLPHEPLVLSAPN